MSIDRNRAEQLLTGLVTIRSHSREEAEATRWLCDQMQELGLERCHVDVAGNAIGELGAVDARRCVVLLGHIDTVPGEIPVRVEAGASGDELWGRGTVDAKGPLACFTIAAARLGSDWAYRHDLRLIVVGAVEEESASSKGARFVRDSLQGERTPRACVIGEPSRWNRVTLGYKGRLLLEIEAARPLAHTAGPDPGIATAAIEAWQSVTQFTQSFNTKHERAFDQLLPSLRTLDTTSDGLEERIRATIGIRLPPGFDPTRLCRRVDEALAQRIGARVEDPCPAPVPGEVLRREHRHGNARASLLVRGYEPAWRSPPHGALVAGFLAAIREVGGNDADPRFVVKTGTSDMNVVGPAWQCPILAYGPGDSALDHTPQERLSLDEYDRAIDVLTRALESWAASA